MRLATLRLFAGECLGDPSSGFHTRVVQHSIRTMSTIFSLGEGCRFKDATNSVGRRRNRGLRARTWPSPIVTHDFCVALE